jgi:hypothetical protein
MNGRLFADVDLVREMTVTKFRLFREHVPRFTKRSFWLDKRLRIMGSGLLAASGSLWVSLRAAMQPLFHASEWQAWGEEIVNKPRCVHVRQC